MNIKTCEERILNEVELIDKGLVVVTRANQDEHDNKISKTYFRVFNKLLGYITNFNVACDSIEGFIVDDIEFGNKDQAIVFEIINNNHIILNEFIKIASKNVESESGEPLLWKEEVYNPFISANQLEDIVNLLK